MSQKIEVHDTFEGLFESGDTVRFYFPNGAGHVDSVATVYVGGSAGLITPAVALTPGEVDHVEILRKAPPPVESAFFGETKLTFEDGKLFANGNFFTPEYIVAVLWMGFRGEYAAATRSIDHALRHVERRPELVCIRPKGLYCGCVHIPLDELRAALNWCAARLGWL